MLIHPRKTLRISGYIPAPTTNNRAEWAAVIEAVARLKEPCEVVVYSDSMICVNAINRRGKKDSKRGNKDLVLSFREVAMQHTVSAVFVRGHVGHEHNEACDAAATVAMREKRDSYPASLHEAERARRTNRSPADVIVWRPWRFGRMSCAIVVQSAQKELQQSRRNADFFASFLGAFSAFGISSCAIVTTSARE
jgi:ribonuclease HI